MSTTRRNLGHATAYGYAKAKGYTGTAEEFAELMASYAEVAQEAGHYKDLAEGAASAAAGSASSANQSKIAAAESATAAANSATAAAQVFTIAGDASFSIDEDNDLWLNITISES